MCVLCALWRTGCCWDSEAVTPAVRGVSLGFGKEQQHWLGKAGVGGHLLFWGSEAQRGERVPTLCLGPPWRVVAGLEAKPGLFSCRKRASIGGRIMGGNEETGVETTALVQERSKEQLTLGGTGARGDGGNENWQ